MIKTEIKQRLSPKTTPKFWAKVRNIAGLIAGVGGILIAPVCPFSLGATAITWIEFITAISASVASTAHLTKK